MEWVSALVVSGIAFFRSTVGIVTRPYETYRRITRDAQAGELLFIGTLLAAYFAVASLLKVAAFRPFLLTEQFVTLYIGAVSGVFVSVGMLRFAGWLLGSTTPTRTLLVGWSYTLLPTVLWFLVTSVLSVILPPPRTVSVPGTLFSLLFVAFSVALLWWKITLAYLVLRFGLKFDLKRNIIVALISAPVLAAWSTLMYKWGIFKVPFL